MNATRIILDTDPGLGAPGADIDDGLAIALAARSPELALEALTIVVGNVDVRTGEANAKALAERLGIADVPIAVGAGKPLIQDLAEVRDLFGTHLLAGEAAGPDRPGAGDAARLLVDMVMASPHEITIVAIGPMTNVAAAIVLEPAFAENVAELVLMAGSATTYAQNITPVADFNAYADPEALQIVLNSSARIRMVGLDQTSRVMLTRADAARMREDADPFGIWAADCTDAWIDFLGRAFPDRPEHRDACFLHDPLTIAAVIDPSLLRWAPAYVQVELEGRLGRGMAVADRGLALMRPSHPPNAEVAVDVDVDRFRSLFLDRIRTGG